MTTLPADWRQRIGIDGMNAVASLRGAGRSWEEIDVTLLHGIEGGTVQLDSEPDSVPQPEQILGNASRTLTLMDHRIETVRKQLAELEGQREAYVRDLRKLGGG